MSIIILEDSFSVITPITIRVADCCALSILWGALKEYVYVLSRAEQIRRLHKEKEKEEKEEMPCCPTKTSEASKCTGPQLRR